MSRFDDRLEQDLDHIADKATPSPTAWEAVQSRIAEQADQPEMEIIVLQPDPPKTLSKSTWVLGAAAAAVLIVGGVTFALRSDDNTSSIRVTDTTARPVQSSVPTPETTARPVQSSVPTPETTARPVQTSVPTPETTAVSTIDVNRVTIVGNIDVDPDSELIVGTGHGSFEVTEGFETLGCAGGTIEETYSFQTTVDKVMTCTSGARTGTFAIRTSRVSGWEITGGTGDFIGLSGGGNYHGRRIVLDLTSFANPIYVFVQQTEYSDTMPGVIEFE